MTTVEANYGPCLNCPSAVDLVEMGNVLEVFWVPIWSFSSERLLHCRTCGMTADVQEYHTLQTMATPPSSERQHATTSCTKCGAIISGEWYFCPGCGIQL